MTMVTSTGTMPGTTAKHGHHGDIHDILHDAGYKLVTREPVPTPAPCAHLGPNAVEDCDGNCFVDCRVYGLPGSTNCTVLQGDYICDFGQRILSSGNMGPNFNCEIYGWDAGDCMCQAPRTMTCSGYCLTDQDCASASTNWDKQSCEDWLRDDVCDYGQRISDAGINMHFECARFNWDNMACDQNASCGDINNETMACPANWGTRIIPTAFPTSEPSMSPTMGPTRGSEATCGDAAQDIAEVDGKIDRLTSSVATLSTSLGQHITAFNNYVRTGGQQCVDDPYAQIEVAPGFYLYCDELDHARYNDCTAATAMTKCCQTCSAHGTASGTG